MKEGIDPELTNKWETKLAKLNLSPIEDQEKVPIEMVPPLAGEQGFTEEMETILETYESLPLKIKVDIIDDLKKKHQEGVNYKNIVDRLELLAEEGTKLMKMDSKDSDEKHKPRPVQKEDGPETNPIEKLIERLERSAEEASKPPEEKIH